MRSTQISHILFLIILCVTIPSRSQANVQLMNTPPNESKTSRIIIKFRNVAKNLNDNPTQIPASIQVLNKKFHVQRISKLLKTTAPNMNVSLFEHVYLLKLNSTVDVSKAVMEYSQDPHVVYAQPDYIAHTQTITPP